MDYNDKLKLAKEALDSGSYDKETIEYIFPELKESEDERIRKGSIEYFLHYPDHEITYYGLKSDSVVAWLEKQGEKKAIDDLTPQEVMDVAVAKCFEQGEQKPVDKVEPKFKVGQTIKKKDFNLGFTIVKIEDGFYYNDKGDYFPFTDEDNWELVEQNPAWSEDRSKELSLSLQIQAYLNTASDELYAKGKPLYSEKRIEDVHKCMLMWQKEQEYTCYEEAFEDGAKWKVENLWKPADGDDLPDIDREVVVLIQDFPDDAEMMRVAIAHRPNPDGWDGKSITTGKVEHYTPKTYDKGGWNIPNIIYWLDVKLPKEIEL